MFKKRTRLGHDFVILDPGLLERQALRRRQQGYYPSVPNGFPGTLSLSLAPTVAYEYVEMSHQPSARSFLPPERVVRETWSCVSGGGGNLGPEVVTSRFSDTSLVAFRTVSRVLISTKGGEALRHWKNQLFIGEEKVAALIESIEGPVAPTETVVKVTRLVRKDQVVHVRVLYSG
ncbi:hypothetical protein FIBSPDRAFT_885111 [Athelia psychrophila]|uniref:Uncharacterized protein n=1 Tax=Athelia psychrophila TaxID=1759441 RepID=A0A166SEL6_9AGAM|nr:hypothetical protein FIBSPDRAFT_885111 [Fibularhizoctonia sp. CBS 109695]